MLNFYLDHIRILRTAACMPLGNGSNADHALHLRLHAEELREFLKAEAQSDLRGKADALGDTVVVAGGYLLDADTHTLYPTVDVIADAEDAAEANGINLPAAFMMIHDSNMSKLCTADQVEPTKEKYRAHGVELEFRDAGNGMWSAFAANDTPFAPKGKWLKGVGFFEPDWSQESIWKL